MAGINKICKWLTVSAFILGGVAACTARLDIDTSSAAQRIAIYGYITNDEKQHEVYIQRTQSFFSKSRPDHVSGALVELRSGAGEVYGMYESFNVRGTYITEKEFKGVEDETYTLVVTVDWDGDGEVEAYEASCRMLYGVVIDHTELKWSDNFSNHIELLLWGRVPQNQDSFFSFHVSRNDEEIVNDSLRNFSIFDGKYYNTEDVVGLACYFLDQDEDRNKLYDGDEVTLHMGVLTREYGTFLKNARKEVNGSIPLFGGPPALVKGNIRQTAGKDRAEPLGFFAAYPITRHTTVYDESKR